MIFYSFKKYFLSLYIIVGSDGTRNIKMIDQKKRGKEQRQKKRMRRIQINMSATFYF